MVYCYSTGWLTPLCQLDIIEQPHLCNTWIKIMPRLHILRIFWSYIQKFLKCYTSHVKVKMSCLPHSLPWFLLPVVSVPLCFSPDSTATLIHFIMTRLDYCCSFYVGLPTRQLDWVWAFQYIMYTKKLCVKLWHSIRAVSGSLLSSSGLEEAL